MSESENVETHELESDRHDEEEATKSPPSNAEELIVKPAINSQQTPSFSNSMSMEQVRDALVKIFARHYEQNSINEGTISDYLSVRKLRVIIRILKLADVSESSLRKPFLCALLEKFLLTDEMAKRYKNFLEEKEKAAKVRAEKRAEKQAQKLSAIQSPNREPKQNDGIRTRNKSTPNYSEHGESRPKTRYSDERHKKSDNQPLVPVEPIDFIGGGCIRSQSMRLHPLTVDCAASALQVLQRCSKVVWEISARVTELERAVSVLLIRVSEAEKIYM